MLFRRFSSRYEEIIKFRLNFLTNLSPNIIPQSNPITITYLTTKVEGISHNTTPISLLKSLNLPTPIAALIKYINPEENLLFSAENETTHTPEGEIYDLNRPLEGDCKISFIN